jgi:uncharacterized protein YndB with AHSA1/START domain
MEGKVERSIWIDAARERVWQAIFDPDEIAQWFLPPSLGARMKREDTGILFVLLGPMEIPVEVFETVKPMSSLTTRSLPERLLATTHTLSDERNGTRVTVTMTGFEAIPEDARADRMAPTESNWGMALENLKARVAGLALPHPEGRAAALFGFRRQAPNFLALERSIWIGATRERVWSAITDPEMIEKWFSPGTPWTLTALEVGGQLFVRNSETGAQMYTQIMDVVDPPHRLVLRSLPQGSEVLHFTTYTLSQERDGTRLAVTYSGYEIEPEDTRGDSMEQTAFGYGMMLDNIRAVAEGSTPPYPGGF